MAQLTSLFLHAGVDVLPGWTRAMHRLKTPTTRKPVIRAGTQWAGRVVRWALRIGSRA